MNKITLKKNEERRIISGHLWVFSNEIHKIDGEPENGDLVEVYDSKNNLLGLGFYNKNSLISVRLLNNSKIENLKSLFESKLKSAFELRRTLYPTRNSFRFVFSESDFLPGLIIDKYNDTFVLQVYSFGMERNIEIICDLLKDISMQKHFHKKRKLFSKA